MSFKIEYDSGTSRNSEKQDLQEEKEKFDRYLTELSPQKKDKSIKEEVKKFFCYLAEKLGLMNISSEKGCMKINVTCRSLEILDRLWDDYHSGHLNEVAEEYLITEQVKDELGMEAIKLKTTILEEDYLACKSSLSKTPG